MTLTTPNAGKPPRIGRKAAVKLALCPVVTRRSSQQRTVDGMNTTIPTTATHDSSTAETLAEIHEFYIEKVNALVAEDNEWMIPSLTDEYDRVLAHAAQIAHAA
jgi:hypothetical protein